jgi:predicted ATPase with chaperone activity
MVDFALEEGNFSRQLEPSSLMRTATSELNLSARAYHRILKLARTIADLARFEEIQPAYLAEALLVSQPAALKAC